MWRSYVKPQEEWSTWSYPIMEKERVWTFICHLAMTGVVWYTTMHLNFVSVVEHGWQSNPIVIYLAYMTNPRIFVGWWHGHNEASPSSTHTMMYCAHTTTKRTFYDCHLWLLQVTKSQNMTDDGQKWTSSKCDWRLGLTWKYDCHIWLGVHQTRSLSFPMKAHVVPICRIRYICRILQWYMTASHIFEFCTPQRSRPGKMWLHVVTNHP